MYYNYSTRIFEKFTLIFIMLVCAARPAVINCLAVSLAKAPKRRRLQ